MIVFIVYQSWVIFHIYIVGYNLYELILSSGCNLHNINLIYSSVFNGITENVNHHKK